jgi:hypothetical protein
MSTEYARAVLETLDHWANQLAAPLLPPRIIVEGDLVRLLLREHIPHTVMVAKSIRAVSGLRAAVLLAEDGYVTECASLLRMVSDFCSEITAVGEALHRGGQVPAAVQTFVDQYFTFKHRTPEALAAAERTRYVAREELMKAEVRMAEGTDVDPEKLRTVKRYLNMAYDSYVHGAYESTMELCDPNRMEFMMRGHRSAEKRAEFVEAALCPMEDRPHLPARAGAGVRRDVHRHVQGLPTEPEGRQLLARSGAGKADGGEHQRKVAGDRRIATTHRRRPAARIGCRR